VRGKVRAEFADIGEQTLKNITRLLRVYCAGSAVAPETPAAPTTALPLRDKPSIAVLPFANLSGDPEQEYFVDGMVEEIITALSRIRWLFVIARNSTFTYKGQTVDVKQVGRELGVMCSKARCEKPAVGCASPECAEIDRDHQKIANCLQTTKTTKLRIRENAYDATLCFGLEPIPKSISHSLTAAPMTSALSSCK
jgi:hypothetical protein